GRRNLEDVADQPHPLELALVEADLRRVEHVEGLRVRDASVDHEDGEAGVWVMAQERLGEHAGMRQVVPRDDRAGSQASCSAWAVRRSRSESTIISTSSGKETRVSQPSFSRAFEASPTRWSTSAGRRNSGSVFR